MENTDQDFTQWLVNLRRDFHAHPELAFEEQRTTDKLTALLEEMGIPAQRFEKHTGVVGLRRGRSEARPLACVRTSTPCRSPNWEKRLTDPAMTGACTPADTTPTRPS